MSGDDRKPPLRRFTAEEERGFADEDEGLKRKRREAKELLEALKQAKTDDGGSGRLEFGFSYLGFRAPTELKLRIDAAAKAAGRSMSTEVQFRLERSLQSESAFAEALALLFETAEGEIPVERIAAWLKQKLDERIKER